MTFTKFLALDNENRILARCTTLAKAQAVPGCVRTRIEFTEQAHRMFLDDEKQSGYEKSLKAHAEKIAEKFK